MTRIHALFAVLFGVALAACAAMAPFVAPAEKATCVLIRAESPSGTADAVCAVADDLAPYVADILSRRAAMPAKLSPPPADARTIVLPLPTHPVERRRCSVWEHLPERDGGADGH